MPSDRYERLRRAERRANERDRTLRYRQPYRPAPRRKQPATWTNQDLAIALLLLVLAVALSLSD